VPYACQVGVDHVAPGLLGQVRRGSHRRDAGVGADDIQAAQFGDAVIEGFLKRAVVAHVSLGGDDPAVQGFDLFDRLSQVVRCCHRVGHRVDLAAQVDGDDVRAFLGEADGVAAALATCRPGDECDFSFYSSRHHCLLAMIGIVTT
jgi:hypothetical protein